MKRALVFTLAATSAATLAVAFPAQAQISRQMDFHEGGSDISSLFYSPIVTPGEDRFLLLSVTTLGPTARVVSASYGIAPLTFYGEVLSPSGNCRMEWWGLVAPVEGSNPLRLSLATLTANLGVTTMTFTGVNQLQPTAAFVAAGGLDAPLSVTVPSAPGQVVLDGGCAFATDADIAMAGPDQAAHWHWTFGPHHSAGSEKAGADQVTLSWGKSGTGALEWASAGLALRPATDVLPPVKLAVDTAGCAVAPRARAGAGEKSGSPVSAFSILLLSLFGAATTRRRRGPAQR